MQRSQSLQPWLHELSVCVDGNVTALSDHAGQIQGAGAQGIYVDDRRVVSRLLVQLGEQATSPVGHSSSGSRSDFLGSARHLGDAGVDPTVEVRRHRKAAAMGVVEEIVVVSRAVETVVTELVVRIAGDGADISAVKSGGEEQTPLVAAIEGTQVRWTDDRHDVRVTIQAPDARTSLDDGGGGVIRVPVRIPPGGHLRAILAVTTTRVRATDLDANAGSLQVDWSDIRVKAQDSALEPTVIAALDDLRHLLMTDPAAPEDVFAAAGSPWYLTLFGRDSLWAARMMLPFGTELAAGTLRALARRQGTTLNESRAEAPGKIPHELRRNVHGDSRHGLALPPAYYGTVDATSLWICLLHDAWRWGLPTPEVESLLPNLNAAVRWLTEHASPDGDQLLKYVDSTGTGLANQGWKDSGDSIRWRDGRIAGAPIALIEAQAYAVEAATCASALLDGLGRPGGPALLAWAQALRDRVRERFWVAHDQPGGPWLGIAVDGLGQTVDGLGSNIGHVLGTGLLDAEETQLVANTLTSDLLLDTFGIRTLASDNGGYNPIGYHTGSIWTHDTAICAWNLSRAGYPVQAALVARTLLASSVAFDYHWPELYAGSDALGRPAAYPAACRPQAWAAASAATLISVALGFEPDAPAGRLILRPCRPAPFGALTVSGLRFAGKPLEVDCAADGETTVTDSPGVNVEVV